MCCQDDVSCELVELGGCEGPEEAFGDKAGLRTRAGREG